MAGNKGKPSGKYSATKTGPGRKRDYQRTGWSQGAPIQIWTQKAETKKLAVRFK